MIKKKNLTQEDKEVWESFTNQPTNIYDKEHDNKQDSSRQDRLKYDLHGLTLDEANKKVKEILLSGAGKKYKEILLITGKGLHSTSDKDVYVSKDLSKLKYSVPQFIKSDLDLSKYILSVSNADISDGGDGAIIVKIKKL